MTGIQKIITTMYYLLLFVFFGFISYNIPLTGDDWTWGSSLGMERLENWFKNYNGRYVSNILEIILTRNDWFRVLFLTVISTLLVVLTSKLTMRKNQKIAMLVALFFYMLIPTKIFAQTFGWTAGYVNYVFSIVLLLIYLTLIKNIFNEDAPTYKKYINYLMIPLGLITQLVVEHVTLFSIYTGFLVIIYTYFKHKKHYAVHWIYFISSIIGGIIMFTNGAYLKILIGEDSYRTVKGNTGILERFYVTYKESMYQFLFIENVLIQLVISVLIIALVLRTKINKKWIEIAFKPFVFFVTISFNLFLLIFKDVMGDSYLGIYTKDFEAIFTLVFFVTMILSALIFVQQKNTKIRLMYYTSGIVLLTIPFVFITPYGPRCVFGSYSFMVFFVIELLVYLSEEYNWSFHSLKKCLLVSNIVLMLAFSFILHLNGDADKKRIKKVEMDIYKNIKVMKITELPYPQFHWMTEPKSGIYHTKLFKSFHDIPDEVEIKNIPYFRSER